MIIFLQLANMLEGYIRMLSKVLASIRRGLLIRFVERRKTKEFYYCIISHGVKFCVKRKTKNVSGLRFDSLSRRASIMSKGSFIFM